MDTLRAMVASEDALVKLVECAPPNAPVTVEVTAHLGGIALRFNAEGTAFDAADIGERLYLNEHTHQDAATNILFGGFQHSGLRRSESAGTHCRPGDPLYLITSMAAIGVGLLTYRLFPIGSPALSSAVSDAASATIAKCDGVKLPFSDQVSSLFPVYSS